MANTTDLLIVTFCDDDAIKHINERTGLDFRKLSDEDNSGGERSLSLEAYGTCPRSIGATRIEQVIAVFKVAPFTSPELTSLTVVDDDLDYYDGVYLADSGDKI